LIWRRMILSIVKLKDTRLFIYSFTRDILMRLVIRKLKKSSIGVIEIRSRLLTSLRKILIYSEIGRRKIVEVREN
jgi:hypothetical protein